MTIEKVTFLNGQVVFRDSITKQFVSGPNAKPSRRRKKRNPTTKFAKVLPSQQVVNRIAFIVDESGSMYGLSHDVIDKLNEQINLHKAESDHHGHHSFASIRFFNSNNHAHDLLSNIPIANVQNIPNSSFCARGLTPLWDAVGDMIDYLLKTDNGTDSYLILVFTDGHENNSYRYSAGRLATLIQSVQATDRWTIAFNVPPGHARNLSNLLGIPLGNIREWEGTQQGWREASAATSVSTQSYYVARSAGRTSVRNFYTDLSNVSDSDIQAHQDVRSNFQTWKVEKEEQIRDFVENRLAHNALVRSRVGFCYEAGRAFYQLMKSEKVQSYKDIVIRDKKTGNIYSDGRDILGIPSGQDVRLKPLDHRHYDIFVQSTSNNRKVVRGTTLLYKIT